MKEYKSNKNTIHLEERWKKTECNSNLNTQTKIHAHILAQYSIKNYTKNQQRRKYSEQRKTDKSTYKHI